MRLIDKDELRKKALIVDDLCETGQGFYIIPAPVFDNAPIVDAVEVVRCKDCEYGFDWDRDEPYDEVYCAGYCKLREADEVIVQVYSCDYCSYGERRSNG